MSRPIDPALADEYPARAPAPHQAVLADYPEYRLAVPGTPEYRWLARVAALGNNDPLVEAFRVGDHVYIALPSRAACERIERDHPGCMATVSTVIRRLN